MSKQFTIAIAIGLSAIATILQTGAHAKLGSTVELLSGFKPALDTFF